MTYVYAEQVTTQVSSEVAEHNRLLDGMVRFTATSKCICLTDDYIFIFFALVSTCSRITWDKQKECSVLP